VWLDPPDPTNLVLGSVSIPLLALVPFVVMTLIRWIITARWRFGPRW
jgi:hypothetical protein